MLGSFLGDKIVFTRRKGAEAWRVFVHNMSHAQQKDIWCLMCFVAFITAQSCFSTAQGAAWHSPARGCSAGARAGLRFLLYSAHGIGMGQEAAGPEPSQWCTCVEYTLKGCATWNIFSYSRKLCMSGETYSPAFSLHVMLLFNQSISVTWSMRRLQLSQAILGCCMFSVCVVVPVALVTCTI